uniref:Uncharacterized protein n=1 Tax=Heliothis virescens TaxID=7102 RepID=A0A2A4K9R1_HELVI
MSVMVKRWYRSRRSQFIIFTITLVCIIYYLNLHASLQREPDLDLTRRFIENRIEEALREDKGTGCEIPHLDPFAKEVMQFDVVIPPIKCKGNDWVRCYHSECRVVKSILKTTKNVVCKYQDIIYENDYKYHLGPPTEVVGDKPYILDKSDHVKVKCTGTHEKSLLSSTWVGYTLGFRKSVERKSPPPFREDSLNVLIFGFDSTSKNGFIRKMPKSYEYLKNTVKATILHGFIENRIEEALREDKGTGCEIPHLDPFAKEVMQFDVVIPPIKCKGNDWVRCYHSECRVVKSILKTTKNVVCKYQDIIYENDYKYHLGPPTEVVGDKPYILDKSDHVKVKCTGTHEKSLLSSTWVGYTLGFRKSVERKSPPPFREDSLNVLIFGFDSTSKNGFIRKMPKSYEYLKNTVKATILHGYNIVGDGTPAALFPILTGKTELELPDVRKTTKTNGTLDSMPFIFYKLKEDGYRTAYFEDMPWIGTFQYRFNGFRRQPADHYLRSFYLEESTGGKKWWQKTGSKFCVGDTPQFQLMMNITDQFLRLDGKRFGFTFIADITHDNANMISVADDAMLRFLQTLVQRNVFEDTLFMVMGDHGPR